MSYHCEEEDHVTLAVAQRAAEQAARWKHVADVLARELRRWGWGDFHYGSQPQDQSVCDALAVYENALNDGVDDGSA